MPDDLSGVHYGFRIPGPEAIGPAAAEFSRRLPAWAGEEGPRTRLVIGPGMVAVERVDLNRRHATVERAADRRDAQLQALLLGMDLEPDASSTPKRGTVAGWSPKSRTRMLRSILSQDLTFLVPTRGGPLPAMLTLTLPGDWLTVAPTSEDWSRLVRAWLERYHRAWGERLRALWKKEFQRRGAPHLHMLSLVPHGLAYGHLLTGTPVPGHPPDSGQPGGAQRSHTDRYRGYAPTQRDVLDHLATLPRRGSIPAGAGLPFWQWIGVSWADVVAHPDPVERLKHEHAGTAIDHAEGLRSSDPRRIAVYFLKHSAPGQTSKEYQHIPPEEWGSNVGRYWGSWGIDTATATVDIPAADGIRAARILRGWARAQGTTREVSVWRSAGVGRFRTVRRRVHRMPGSAGFVALNDAPAFALQLARALNQEGPIDASDLAATPRPPRGTEPRPGLPARRGGGGGTGWVSRHAARAGEEGVPDPRDP